MPDPFELSQYITYFTAQSQFIPDPFAFAGLKKIYADIAEKIKMRQAACSIGFQVPNDAWTSPDAYSAGTPSGIVDGILLFQTCISEFVQGQIIDQYGVLPSCASPYVGFFMYSNGNPIVGIENILPDDNFSSPPDPTSFTNLFDFTKSVITSLNEIIFALNNLRYIHGIMYYEYYYENECESSVASSIDSSAGSSIDSSAGSSIDSSAGSSADSSANSSVDSSVNSSFGSSTGSSFGSGGVFTGGDIASIGSSVNSSAGSSVGSSVNSSVGSSVNSSVGSSIGSSVGSSAGSSVGSGGHSLPVTGGGGGGGSASA